MSWKCQVWTKLSRGEAASKPTSRLGAPVGLVVTPRHHVKWPKLQGSVPCSEVVGEAQAGWENDWLPMHLLCLGFLFDICNVRLNKNTCVWQAHVKFRALKFKKTRRVYIQKGLHGYLITVSGLLFLQTFIWDTYSFGPRSVYVHLGP